MIRTLPASPSNTRGNGHNHRLTVFPSSAPEHDFGMEMRRLTPREIDSRFFELCVLNARVFGAPPESQTWSLDHRGRDRDSAFWDPWSNCYSYFTLLRETDSDFFIWVKPSDRTAAAQVGLVFDHEFIESHEFGQFGAKPGDYYQAVIFTDLACQRQGLGKELVASMLERARERGCPRIFTRCRDGNARILDLVQRHYGFSPVGTMRVGIGGTVSTRYVLCREL